MKRMFLMVALFCLACSIPDPGDEEKAEHMVGAMAPQDVDPFIRAAMGRAARDWLADRYGHDQLFTLECRTQSPGQKWTGWSQGWSTPRVVLDVLACIGFAQAFQQTYEQCINKLVSQSKIEAQQNLRQGVLRNAIPAYTNIECRHVFRDDYDPAKAPAKVRDPKAITKRDIVRELISLPAPPPGFPVDVWAPVLCPLGAGDGWGCPPPPIPGGSAASGDNGGAP